MAKLVMMLFAAAAVVQLIKPIGLPGLRYRRDAWKLVIAALFIVVMLVGLRPEGT